MIEDIPLVMDLYDRTMVIATRIIYFIVNDVSLIAERSKRFIGNGISKSAALLW